MDIPMNHSVVAKLTLSGTDIVVGTYDNVHSSSPSIWFQTNDNPEPVYVKVAEAELLVASLLAVIDYISNGE